MVFVLVERRRPNPMLDLALLRNAPFTTLLVAGALLSAAAWASMTYESLWLQSVLGLTPIKAGLVLLQASLAAFTVSAAIGRVLHTASPRLLIGTGLLVIAAGALAQGVIRSGSSWWVVMPGLFLVGIGAGLTMAPMSATAMAAVPHPRAGMAGGAVSTFRQLGYAFGIAVLGEVFHAGLARVAGAPLVHRAFAAGLDQTFIVAAGLGVLAGVLVLVFGAREVPGARAGRRIL